MYFRSLAPLAVILASSIAPSAALPRPDDATVQSTDAAAKPPPPPPPPPAPPAPPAQGGGTWAALANITSNGKQFPRQEHSVVSLGSDVYALGGILPFDGTTYPTVAKVQKYSTTTNTWTDLPDMPAALNHANVAVVKNKIYVCGGLAVTATGGPAYWGPSGSCSVYDPSSNKWSVLADMPAARAVGAAATLVSGDTIYYAGGLKYTNLTNDDEGTVTLFSSYNTATKKWTSLPDMPAPRDHAGKGIVGNTLYVLGGRSFGHYNVVNTVFAYNIDSNCWQSSNLAPMPTARGGVSSATIGNKIYISGGEGDRATATEVFPQMEVYDAGANRWTKLTNMARPVHGTDSAVVAGKVYVVGGGSTIGGAPTAWTSSFTP